MLTWIFRITVIGVLTLLVAGIMALAGEVIWWLAVVTAALLYSGEAFVIRRAFGNLFENLVSAPFKMKGSVLRDAEVVIHDVKPTERPAPQNIDPDDEDEGEEEEEEAFDAHHIYFKIDATIRPTAETQQFKHWEPAELSIVPHDAPPEEDSDGDDSHHAILHDVMIYDGSKFVEDEGMKYEGDQRILMVIGISNEVKQAKFRYYFEDFGSIVFP